MGFLDDYEPVEDRLRKFWTQYPNGRVVTELVSHADGQWVFRAEVYRDADDLRPFAVGYAHEVQTSRGVNSTSAAENCETSAIGRALSNGNFAPKGKRPSREEMSKAQRGPQRPQPQPDEATVTLDDLKKRVAALPSESRADLKVRFGWPPKDMHEFTTAVVAAELGAQAAF